MKKVVQTMDWPSVVAKRTINWEDGANGGAVLLVPRFRRGPLARWLMPRLKDPFIRLKLDEIGSFVWKKIDGAASFQTIVDAMKSNFGEKIEPADARLQKFLSILYKDKFVELFVPR